MSKIKINLRQLILLYKSTMMLIDLHRKRFSDVVNLVSFRKLLTVSVVSMIGLIAPSKATNFTVSNTNDNGPGSFRAAVVSSNFDVTATAGSPHIIDMTGLSGAIVLDSALTDIRNHVIINGPANNGLSIERNQSAASFSIISVKPIGLAAITVELNNLVLTKGSSLTGGGLYAENTNLTVNNCQVTKNFVNNGLGGGICTNNANVTINNSTIDYNTNLAGLGGGIYMNFGSLLMNNCTVFGNRAAIGGGLDKATIGNVVITNCTFAYDTADDVAGGIYINLGNIEANNTLITGNIAVNGANAVFGNMFSTNGHNLVDNVLGMNFTGNTSGNIIGLASNFVLSNTLQNNGGVTPTVLPVACSAAIDAGTSVGAPLTDQRGLTRANFGTNYDIGAVEYSGPNAQDQFVCGTQTITLVASGSTNYRWYDAETGGNILLEGSNSLTVTVSSDTTFWVVDYTPDCESTIRVAVHVTQFTPPSAPVISTNGNTAFCAGGAVTINSTTSPDYVAYEWIPNGETSTSISANNAGDYQVVITDVNGCTASSNIINVTVNPLPVPVITANGSTIICQGSSITLTSSFASGNVWSTGETTESITVSTAQSITVTVTDANGCVGTSAPVEISIVPNAPPAPIISASGSLDICVGSNVILTSSYLSGNTWSPNGETTQSITVNQAGTFTVTFTDANGCSAVSQPITVNVLPQAQAPTVAANGPTTFCEGGNVELNALPISSSIIWNPGNLTGNSITVNATGSYTATITDNNGCTATSLPIDVVVNANPSQPSINAFGPTTFCQGSSVTLFSSSSSNNTWSQAGETTNSIIVSNAGNYTVTVTNAAGCSATSDPIEVTVLQNPTAPIITASGPTTFCIGGSITLTSDITNNIVWNTGATNAAITVSLPDAYSVIVTDANNCTAQSNIIDVVINNPGLASISGNSQFCVGGSTTLTAVNGVSFIWSPNGETTQSISVSNPGIYSVTITGPNGCTSVSAPVLVNAFASTPVTVSPSGTIQICDNGSVTLTSSSLTGNVWSPNGETTPSITVSTAGDYFVTATDANGCSSVSNTVNVVVLPAPQQPNINPSGPIVQCGGSVLLDAGFINGVTYLWNDNITSTQTNSVSQSGTYSVTVTSPNGCTNVSNLVNVSIETIPVVNLGNDITQCGGTVTLNAGNPGATYLWSNGETTQTITLSASATINVTVTNTCGSTTSNTINVTINNIPTAAVISPSGPIQICNGSSQVLSSNAINGNVWSPNGETTQNITVTASGSYFTTVTDVNGCTATSNAVVVNVTNPIAQVNIGNDITQCGGTVTLNAGNPGATYLWSNGLTTQTITVASSGAFSVDVTNACGTVTSNTVNITINTVPFPPTISPGGPVVFCQGNSVILNSSEPNGNTWSTGATTPSIVISNSGTFTVTFTDVNGCTAVSAPLIVTEDIPLTAPNLGGPFVQCAGSVILDAGISNGSTTFQWSTGATTQSISVSQSGVYNVVLTNSCGSVQSSDATVTINPLPAPPVITPLGQTTFCSGGSLILSSNIANGITWSTGETTQTITVTQSGIYSVNFNDGNSCSSSSLPITVTVQNPPTATNLGGPFTQCGGSVTLDALNAGPGTLYLWNNNATSQVLTVQQSGTYFVTIANTCGTVQSSAAVVDILSIPPAPVISANGPTTICSNNSVDLSSDLQQNYLWSNGQTTQVISVNLPGDYSVSVTAANGCSATSNVITVNALTPPVATDLGGPYIQCGGSIILDAGNANNGATYLWSNGETTQSIVASASGSYSCVITNSCGTVSSTIADITLFSSPAAPVVSASGATIFCQGGSVDLTSSIANGILWSNNETTATINVTTSGNYSVLFTDVNGCTATSNIITVQVDAPLQATDLGGPFTQCGGTVTLDAGNPSSNNIYLWSSGENTQIITVALSGNYFVTTTNACGSVTSTTADVTINPLPQTPTISASGPTTFCQGGNVVLTSSSSNNNLWSNGLNTQAITVTTSGNYTVSVIDPLGCSATSQAVSVNVDLPLTNTISLGGPFTQCGGAVTLDAGNANTGAAYLWNNGSTTQILNATISGSYFVVVSNSCSSVSSDTAIVNISPAAQTPIITANGPATICNGNSIILTSSETSNIQWAPGGQTTASISVNQSGTYTVTVDNGNGCTAVSQDFIVNVLNNILPVTLGQDITQCGGSVAVDAGAQSGATYVWTDLSGNNQIPNSQIANLTSSGQVFVTISNQCNSVISDTINVIINPVPTTPIIQANGPTTFCTGDSVQLSVTNAQQAQNIIANGQFDAGNSDFTTQYLYQSNLQPEGTSFVTNDASLNHPSFVGTGQGGGGNFLAVNGSSNAGQFIWQQTVTVVPNQTYDISLFLASMVANNNNGIIQLRVDGVDVGTTMNCPGPINTWVPFTNTWTAGASSSAVISLHSMNNASGGNDFGIDNIQMICTSCFGNVTYQWSTSENGTSIYANTTGAYTVTVTDAIGCSSTSLPIDVVVQTPPTVNLGGPYTQCGGSLTLDAQNAGSSYLWSNGDTTQTISISAIGTINVTVTITNTCGSFTSQPASVTILTPPSQATIIANGPTTFCPGDSVVLFASAGSSYLWSPNGETSQSIVANASGNYAVQVTSSNGCTSVSSPVTVTVLSGTGNPAQITASGPTTFCLGESVTLTSNNPTGNLWNNGSNQQSLTVFSAGTYILNVSNNSGCPLGSDTIIVTTLFNPTAVITLSNSPQLCEGDSITLTVNENASYQWNQIVNNQTVNIGAGQTITVDTAGTYLVTVTGLNGCTSTSQTVLIATAPAAQPPVITVNGQLSCGSGSVELVATGGSNFFWNTWSTSQSITVTQSGYYSVTSQNIFGCKATSESVFIPQGVSNMQISLDALVYDNGFWNVRCPKGSDGQITANVSNGQEPYTYAWESGETSQVITGLKAGPDNVYKVLVTDAFGCTVEGSTTLTEPPAALEKMPRGFSPDGNGINDELVIPGIKAYVTNNITIFNRWGNEVYNSEGPYQNDWIGKGKNGDDLPEGTYFIVFTADSPECGKIDENRWIELRRK
jgi:gliding motility-associated-like protein